jgi:multidrug efflux pump
MEQLQRKAMDVVLADPAVAGLGSSVGPSPFNASVNRGRLFISLKPLSQRGNLTTLQVVGRLRNKLNQIPGIRVFMFPAQDLRAGGRQSDSQYQFTLWSSDIDELQKWVPRVLDRVKQLPGIVDVTTGEQGGLQANIVSTGRRPRVSVCACRISTTRLITRFRSARSRPSMARATSIA